MMRRLLERHKGILPLDTVESIWRIIISTFTYVQADYSVHADISGGDAQMRDGCRFHFGFTVPYIPHPSSAEVICAVAAAPGDLGLVPVETVPAAGAWWQQLASPGAPKVIARLPFVERRDHPAGTPLFVLAKPVEDGAARDVVLYAAMVERWREIDESALRAHGVDVIAKAPQDRALLLAVTGALSPAALRETLASSGAGDRASGRNRQPRRAFRFRQKGPETRIRPVVRTLIVRTLGARLFGARKNDVLPTSPPRRSPARAYWRSNPTSPARPAPRRKAKSTSSRRMNRRWGRARARSKPFNRPPALCRSIPDGSVHTLRAAIAKRHGIDYAQVICGAGSDELIFLLAYAYLNPGDEGIYTKHGFSIYRIAILAAGGRPRRRG